MLRPASYILSPDEILSILLVLALSMLVAPRQGGAQSFSDNITIEEGGKIWIEGTAGPVDFSCRAEKLSGRGEIENVQKPKATVTEDGQINISVSLPVKSLNCGKRAMNKDMYGALKAERFPMINYRVLEATLTEATPDALTETEGWMNIRTRGIMEIAGVQDTTSVFIQGKVLNNNRFQVKGSKNIHMDTYNIDPPSKMFGLIRANEELKVHFDVTVTLTDTTL
jgi:hypothetical protein